LTTEGHATSNDDSDPEGTELTPYRLLDTRNRRSAAIVYFVAALVAGMLVITTGVAAMWFTAVVPLIGIGIYQFIAGRPLRISDRDAIGIASDAAPFDVGHSSATLGFTGFTAKPVWEVLVFQSGSMPDHQALLTVDALTGDVTGTYVEAVPSP
jgi:hypothetical protein